MVLVGVWLFVGDSGLFGCCCWAKLLSVIVGLNGTRPDVLKDFQILLLFHEFSIACLRTQGKLVFLTVLLGRINFRFAEILKKAFLRIKNIWSSGWSRYVQFGVELLFQSCEKWRSLWRLLKDD